jgi:hypothetical protein
MLILAWTLVGVAIGGIYDGISAILFFASFLLLYLVPIEWIASYPAHGSLNRELRGWFGSVVYSLLFSDELKLLHCLPTPIIKGKQRILCILKNYYTPPTYLLRQDGDISYLKWMPHLVYWNPAVVKDTVLIDIIDEHKSQTQRLSYYVFRRLLCLDVFERLFGVYKCVFTDRANVLEQIDPRLMVLIRMNGNMEFEFLSQLQETTVYSIGYGVDSNGHLVYKKSMPVNMPRYGEKGPGTLTAAAVNNINTAQSHIRDDLVKQAEHPPIVGSAAQIPQTSITNDPGSDEKQLPPTTQASV